MAENEIKDGAIETAEETEQPKEKDDAAAVDSGKPSVGMLNNILRNTVDTIEQSKHQIFDIYEAARREAELTSQELERLRAETKETIELVDELVRAEQQEKQNLVRVSSNFRDFSEDRVKASYDAVKDVQIRLGIAREKETRLRHLRDGCEIRLYHMQKTIAGAEQLAMRISSVLGYLSSQISDVVAQMEKVSGNRFLAAAIIKAQEDERYRVSREIHDGPAQEVANLLFQVSICERLITVDPDEARANLQDLRRQLKECLSEIRQIIFDMRPMSLDDFGLVTAVQQLTEKLEERRNLKIDFSVEGEEIRLPNHVNVGIFRIIQEALNNVEHHSGQLAAQVRMLFIESAVSVLIVDQGNGFDPSLLAADEGSQRGEGHFGIAGMKERAKIIGAEIAVTSTPGRGTKVHLRLPLKQDKIAPQPDAKQPAAKAKEHKPSRCGKKA